jgi:protein-S-isoprenylcysteine O-methyltransferase Ste14
MLANEDYRRKIRAAFALALGSAPDWVCFAGWVAAIVRRSGREEAHMLKTFGAEYAAYQQPTARLLPGIY